MSSSLGVRAFVVGLLTLVMLVPLDMISDIVDDRADYNRQTLRSVSDEWGGSQVISGPQLVIPVEETVTYERKRKVIDPETGAAQRTDDGDLVYQYYTEDVVEPRPSVYVYPGTYDVAMETVSEIRYRGIFEVPVYTATLSAQFDFPHDLSSVQRPGEVIRWDLAELRVYLSSNRALRGQALLRAADQTFAFEPLPFLSERPAGISAPLGDPRAVETFDLALELNGAHDVQAAAVGRISTITLKSDWPHPSFTGAFLPDQSTISPEGFSASWSIPHLARAVPQISRENGEAQVRRTAAMGAQFYQPNDFYQKAYRSARYAILFIGLTFAAVLLLDRNRARSTHPVQYMLIGLLQALFAVTMVAFAEQIGMQAAFALVACVTILVLTLFARTALGMGARAWGLGGFLTLLYAVLYLILQSTDYALLAGSSLAFASLVATMFVTRNQQWYGDADRKPLVQRLFGRRATAQTERPNAPQEG